MKFQNCFVDSFDPPCFLPFFKILEDREKQLHYVCVQTSAMVHSIKAGTIK